MTAPLPVEDTVDKAEGVMAELLERHQAQQAWANVAPHIADDTSSGTEGSDVFDNPDPETPQKGWRGSTVCAVTFCALAGMLKWLGDGYPDPGDRFVRSGSMFDEASAQSAGLAPDDAWQGSAAHAYAAQNLAQSQRAKLMAVLDHQTAGLVSSQAESVAAVRTILGAEMGVIMGVGVSCVILEETGHFVLSRITALSVCVPAIGFAIYKLDHLDKITHINANNVNAMIRRLAEMMTAFPSISDTISPLPNSPLDVARSEFDADHTVGPLSDDNGSPSETPDNPLALALADLPGSPEFTLHDLPSPGFPDFGASHLPIAQLAGMPRVHNSLSGGLPTAPTANELASLPDFSDALAALTSMAPLRAAVSQFTQLSEAASGLSELSNTAGQQAQTIVSLAQQTAQQATLADHVTQDDDPSGAEPRTPTSDRAPVDSINRPYREGQQHVL